ncbi:muscle M-line assembly protein unc-89-like [Passer domesticus]|uniref:muscle M-line assembly protein unc-89-like n=1 Tax=Passer domesticus TaxID=48849 RepID=UPI0030FF3A39
MAEPGPAGGIPGAQGPALPSPRTASGSGGSSSRDPTLRSSRSDREEDKEGLRSFARMEEEWEYDSDPEFSQSGEVINQDLHLWEEVTVQEFYRQQEVSPCGVVRCQEQHQCEVGVRVQWGDGAQQEMEVFHWEESMTVQELPQWDKEDEIYQELSQLEEDLTYQELSLWEGEGHQEMYPVEKDFRIPMHMYQWEKEKREPELSQVGDNSNKEVCQGKDCSLQKLAQWEKHSSNQNLSQSKESVSSQGLSQWEESVRYKIYDKPLHPEKDKCTQPCAQQGPASPSSVGTPVAAEATHELPSAFSAPGSPTKDELAAAAVPAGATEEVEEPPEPLAPEMEKPPGSPARSEELPLAGTESPVPAPRSPSGSSPALPDLERHISSEVVLEAGLEVQASDQQPEEQGDLEQSMAAETEAAAPEQREESPSSAPHSPPSPSPTSLGAQALREQQEEAVLAEEDSEEETLAGDLELSQGDSDEVPELSQVEIGKYQEESQREVCNEQISLEESGSYQEGSQGQAGTKHMLSPVESRGHQEGSQGEASTEEEMFQGHSSSYQGLPFGEACTEQELSQGGAGSPQKVSELDKSIEKGFSHGDTSSYSDLSDWDECSKEELSQGDRDSYKDFSDWEEYSEQGHSQGETSSSLYPSDWDEFSRTELSNGDVESYQEPSDWEESVSLEFSEEKDSCSQVSSSSEKTSSGKSTWESDSDQDFVQNSWEESIEAKPLLQEDDEWDERSVLELCEDEDRKQRPAGLAGEGFPVPVPCEACVELGAAGPCLVPCASSPHVEALAPRGHTASPAFQEQVPEAGTQRLVPAPYSSPSPSAPQLGAQALSRQQVPHKKRPSSLRWALHSLFHCPCLEPQPED